MSDAVDIDRLADLFRDGWQAADAEGRVGERVTDGLRAVLEDVAPLAGWERVVADRIEAERDELRRLLTRTLDPLRARRDAAGWHPVSDAELVRMIELGVGDPATPSPRSEAGAA